MTAELLVPEAFLTIGEQPISPKQMFRYLQNGRKLEGFLSEILKQFVLERELEQTELPIGVGEIEQAVIDFRLQQQLAEPQKFQQWLQSNGMTSESFHQQVSNQFRVQKLKEVVTKDRLEEYFAERKLHLDRVVLSRIIVADQELADELHSQLQEGAAFETLARDYSLMEDRILNGMVGAISLASMPEVLRSPVQSSQPGAIVGPVGMEGRWGLFRVETFLPAALENDQVRQTLQDELFERWVTERMQNLPMRVQVGS